MAGIDLKSNFKNLTFLFFSILEEQAKMKLCAWAKGTDTCQRGTVAVLLLFQRTVRFASHLF